MLDKHWRTKGLRAYPTSSILETLVHYGVDVSLEGFTADARSFDVLQREWLTAWKGTGPFLELPVQALTTLWMRLKPTLPSPRYFAHALEQLLHGEGQARTALDEMAARLPAEAEPRQRFLTETRNALPDEAAYDDYLRTLGWRP